MNLLLAFSPFIVFVIAERLAGIPVGLAAGAVTAAALLVRDLVMLGEPWSIADVRLRVDAGLLRVALWAAAWFTGWYPQHQRHSAGRT